MSDTRAGERAAFFLLGAAIGAAAALLMAPASGARTRRRLARKSEEVADYLIDAGKELVERCEDLYERSGELVEDATHELAGKYRALCPSAPRQDLAHGHPDPEEQRLAEFLSAFGHFFRFRENRVFHAFRAVRTPAYPTPRPNSS
jgi:YtxH-like protein